jgi:hypothetical protein
VSNNKKMKREIVLRGSCQTNSDMFYFTGVAVADPFYAFTLRGRKCALAGALELGRLRDSGRLDEVFDLSLLFSVVAHKSTFLGTFAHAFFIPILIFCLVSSLNFLPLMLLRILSFTACGIILCNPMI